MQITDEMADRVAKALVGISAETLWEECDVWRDVDEWVDGLRNKARAVLEAALV